MRQTPFHRSCSKIVKKFYEDFDLLPKQAKELIWYGSASPDFDDLKLAWELAGETFSIDNLKRQLHVFEEETKANDLRKAQQDRAKKRAEREATRNNRWARREQVYRWRKVGETRTDKHSRLIATVTAEQAMKLLSGRTETKDIAAAGNLYVREFVGFRDVKVNETLPEKIEKPVPEQHVAKMMHNAGGKK